MILHNLEFEAFMAYPKRQEINFDTLNNAGVFLLNGPTGAGKTTILDAICYALYGETSSDRESAKLHSTYAAHSGTKPRVLLDVTLHGKRLRIDRTPAYNKPITRGARKGQMREESAKATLAELAPGADPADEKAWTPISSSVAEVNRTIAERTHLTKEQFLKVVLLPQGQFAQFLKSKPKERKELLKKMFPVEHYEQLFAALTEEAKTAQQEVAQNENTQRGYLERARAEMLALQSLLDAVDSDAEEAAEAGEETSENLTTENVTAENVTAETLDAWVAGGVERARKTSVREKQEQQRLTNEADRNTRLLAERAQLQADWREYEQLCERRTRLTERADEHKAHREELAQARAAAPLHAQYTQVHTESQALAARQQDQAACASALDDTGRALLAALRDEETPEDVTFPEETTFAALPELEPAEQETQLEALLDTLRALQKKDAQLTDEEAAVAALLKQANALEQDKARAEKTLSDLTAAAEQLAEELAGYSTADEERTLAAHLVTEAQQKLDAAQQMQQKLDAASAAVAEAEKQSKRTATAEQKAQEKWQASAQQALVATEEFKNLQVLRLAQASSLLARELKDGEPCAVCGSVEHPAPAQIAEGEQLVERADLDAAKEREDKAHKQARTHELAKDRATKAHQEASEALAAARTQYETLAAQGECDVEQTAAQLQEAQTRLAQAQSRVTARDGVLAKVERVRSEQQKAQEALRTIESAAVEAQTRHRDAAARCEAAAAELAPARAAVGFAQRVEAVEGYRVAHQRLARAVLLLGHALAAAQAERLLAESSFESAELVQAAVRTPERVDALEQAVAAYELEHARLLEGFGREAIVAVAARAAAGEQAPDDLQGVREQVEQLRAAAHRLTLREGERESMLRSLHVLRGEYAAFRAQTAQRYDRAQMLANLAAAARGDTLGGYEHQVDLVSYVLGAEFERILHSASLHLDRMSEGRYGMVFSNHRAKGSRSGGGLNLEITDTWTGEPREASSLSGGESFLASLSLALGLAEVVQANNGGIELDTLFIDEGFGTLDAETLDMVMGTIESLRDSGRTIGLISHVEEMKNRIPAQIVVEKGQNGSSVRVNS